MIYIVVMVFTLGAMAKSAMSNNNDNDFEVISCCIVHELNL